MYYRRHEEDHYESKKKKISQLHPKKDFGGECSPTSSVIHMEYDIAIHHTVFSYYHRN